MSGEHGSVKVSVIIPTYNRADVLRDNADSILAQHFDDYELIYVDDGSTDETGAILQEYAQEHEGKVRVLKTVNGGPGPARDVGAGIARGEYLLFTDDDVVVPENWIGGMVEHYGLHECDVLCGGIGPYELATPVERYLHYRMQISLGKKARRLAATPTTNTLISRELFLRVGGFRNRSLPAVEDWELSYRLRAAGAHIHYDPAIAVVHRYQKEFGPAARRMRDTGAWGLYVCRERYRSATAYLAYSLLRFAVSPVRLLRHYPPDLFFLALRMEAVFTMARVKAWFVDLVGRNPYTP